MKFCVTSDYHGQYKHEKPSSFEKGDVFLFCGDWTASRNRQLQITETAQFFAWLNTLPFSHKVIIPGNHELLAESDPTLIESLANEHSITYLNESSVTINGITIYGTPYTPMFYDWAFMRTEKDLALRFENIPLDTNILLTHGPAYSILDKTINRDSVGSQALLDAISLLPNLKYHCFGHIHEAYGIQQLPSYTAINASQLTWQYKLDPQPIYFEL